MLIGNIAAYHTPLDTRASIDLSGLQQHGEAALNLSRVLANSDAASLRGGRAIYLDVLGRWLPRLPAGWALPLSTWEQLYVQIGFGVLCLAPFWWLAPAAPITAHNLPLVLYAGTAASIGAPFCWMNGIKRIGPARAAVFMNLLPLLVALGAWGLLGERLHGYHAAGGALVLAGLLWSQRRSRPH